jgi:Ni/Co efflux regulator RcnB
MKRCLLVLSFLMVAMMAVASAARADAAFLCEQSRRLVSRGDHMYDVRNRCGDPDLVTQRLETRKVTHKVRRWVRGQVEEVEEEQEIQVLLDEWVYDLGPQRFIRIVSFENSRVTCVGTGGYGSKRD